MTISPCSAKLTLILQMMSGDVCLKVTLVGVPDPRTVSVELFHHGHGDNRQGGVHVGVLRINQHSDLVYTGLNETAQLNIAQFH